MPDQEGRGKNHQDGATEPREAIDIPGHPANLTDQSLGDRTLDWENGTMFAGGILQTLLSSDRDTNGKPVLLEENREIVLKVLARAIVDEDAREAYRQNVLQQARHLGGATPSMGADVLTDRQADGVLAGGLNTLENADLARLALCLPEIAGLAYVFLEVLSNPDPEVQARYNRLDAWQEALRERLLSRPSGRRAWTRVQNIVKGTSD